MRSLRNESDRIFAGTRLDGEKAHWNRNRGSESRSRRPRAGAGADRRSGVLRADGWRKRSPSHAGILPRIGYGRPCQGKGAGTTGRSGEMTDAELAEYLHLSPADAAIVLPKLSAGRRRVYDRM